MAPGIVRHRPPARGRIRRDPAGNDLEPSSSNGLEGGALDLVGRVVELVEHRADQRLIDTALAMRIDKPASHLAARARRHCADRVRARAAYDAFALPPEGGAFVTAVVASYVRLVLAEHHCPISALGVLSPRWELPESAWLVLTGQRRAMATEWRRLRGLIARLEHGHEHGHERLRLVRPAGDLGTAAAIVLAGRLGKPTMKVCDTINSESLCLAMKGALNDGPRRPVRPHWIAAVAA